MQKLMCAVLLFSVLLFLEGHAFAATMNCTFQEVPSQIREVKSIQITDNFLVINNELEIPLEKSKVRCGHYGRQDRYEGSGAGFTVILKSCTDEAELEGYLVDSVSETAEVVRCHHVN